MNAWSKVICYLENRTSRHQRTASTDDNSDSSKGPDQSSGGLSTFGMHQCARVWGPHWGLELPSIIPEPGPGVSLHVPPMPLWTVNDLSQLSDLNIALISYK